MKKDRRTEIELADLRAMQEASRIQSPCPREEKREKKFRSRKRR